MVASAEIANRLLTLGRVEMAEKLIILEATLAEERQMYADLARRMSGITDQNTILSNDNRELLSQLASRTQQAEANRIEAEEARESKLAWQSLIDDIAEQLAVTREEEHHPFGSTTATEVLYELNKSQVSVDAPDWEIPRELELTVEDDKGRHHDVTATLISVLGSSCNYEVELA